MAFYSDIDCTEVNGARSEQYARGQQGKSTVQLRCPYINSADLVNNILQNRYTDPLRPDHYAEAATIAPEAGNNSGYTTQDQVIIPDTAIVTVTYSALPPWEQDDPGEEEVVSETLEPTIEFQTLNHLLFQWTADEHPDEKDWLKEDEAPGRLLPALKLVRKWSKYQGVIPTQMLTLMGHVNAYPYYSTRLNLLFAAETLLYEPPVLSRSITTEGIGAWDITMGFHFKPHTWNKFWRAATGEYSFIYVGSAETGGLPQVYRNYPLGDIGPLVGG